MVMSWSVDQECSTQICQTKNEHKRGTLLGSPNQCSLCVITALVSVGKHDGFVVALIVRLIGVGGQF